MPASFGMAGVYVLAVPGGPVGSKFLFPGLENSLVTARYLYAIFYGRAVVGFGTLFFPAPLRDFYGRAYDRFWYSFFSAPLRDFYGRAVVLN
jgi:hypothetical protein